ncbi:hypothetical protein VDGD_04824 [Verticillium dahliae]|nr:hypothetical protein VDGD_04824 [Verticillium dahliae]
MFTTTQTIAREAPSTGPLGLKTNNVHPPCTMLRVSGTNIVNAAGEQVVLKGAGLGGMLNMEDFITGYSGHEHEHRAALAEGLGKEKRHQKEGFVLLDRIVDICARHNIYVILDLHAVPGGQNQDWHCDSGLSCALFWEFRDFQDRAIQLWEALAKHYAGNPVIAGYNPLNEPADPQHTRLQAWFERAEKAIRAIDPEHILFVDGNTYAMDFRAFNPKKPLPNTVYSCHDYSVMGFPLPEQYEGTEDQKSKLRSSINRKVEVMRQAGVPIWNGEFGPVYQNPRIDPDAAVTNAKRIALLKEQLSIYRECGGGMVYLDPESPYMRLIQPFVEKKQKLGLDFWGVVDKSGVDGDVYGPFISKLKAMIPEHLHKKKYPSIWTFDRQVERTVRELLMSEYLGYEFAELFKDKIEEELEELAASFAIENCKTRDEPNDILRADATQPTTSRA